MVPPVPVGGGEEEEEKEGGGEMTGGGGEESEVSGSESKSEVCDAGGLVSEGGLGRTGGTGV